MAETFDTLAANIGNAGPQQIATALQTLFAKLNAASAAAAATCVRCGLCADSCHYYLNDHELQSLPAYKLNLVLAVFKRYFTRTGKIAPRWFGARELDQKMLAEWVDALFGRCTMCGRCTINCTSGINIPALVRAARGALAAIDLVPPELQATVLAAVESGNNMAIPTPEWLETVDWLQDELRGELADASARIPIDQAGAHMLYTVNPREPKFFPLSLLAAAKIFHAAGESWTFSKDHYDVTNYGLFSGDDRYAGLLSGRLVDAMEHLRAHTMVLGECGHGFNANRWNAPQWLAKPFAFPVRSIIEVIADYIRQGRITLDPNLNAKPVTLHDPCNLVRHGGIIEEQRFILKHAALNFVEMTPNRQKNYCCGGGGGQLSMSRYAKRRLQAGATKAEQIRRSGAAVVVAPCHNCIDQLSELSREYNLGVEVKTVVEIVGDALVMQKPAPLAQANA